MYTPPVFVGGPFEDELEARRMAMLLWERVYYYQLIFQVREVQSCEACEWANQNRVALDEMD